MSASGPSGPLVCLSHGLVRGEIEFSHMDTFLLCTLSICHYRQLLKYIMIRSYSLTPVRPKFISNKRVFRKIKVRIFEVFTV